MWHLSDDFGAPVNWRLHLPQAWLGDSHKRSQASIPDGVRLESLGECAVRAYLDMPAREELPVRPVVVDAREMDAVPMARRLRAAGVPFMIRVGGALRLTTADATLPGHTADMLAAQDIMTAARSGRRPVSWLDRGVSHTCLTSAVRVRIPVPAQAHWSAGGCSSSPRRPAPSTTTTCACSVSWATNSSPPRRSTPTWVTEQPLPG